MANIFNEQSLMFGYGTTTTSLSGQVTQNKPTANVSGIPTQTKSLSGASTTMKPTENLTGYPVFYTGANALRPDIWSNLDETSITQDLFGVDASHKTLQASGNITLWPTIWTQTDVQGGISNLFVIPGDAPAGSIGYDDGGFPMWNTNYSGPKSIDAPPSVSQPRAPTIQEVAPQTNLTDQAYNNMEARRRRGGISRFTSILGDLF